MTNSKYPVFTAGKGEMLLREFIDQFESLAKADDLSYTAKADKFVACCSMQAFNVLRKLIVDGLPQSEVYLLYVRESNKLCRIIAEKVFGALCQKSVSPEKEDINGYAKEINTLVGAAFERWSPGSRNELSVGFPHCHVARQLFALYKNTPARVRKKKSSSCKTTARKFRAEKSLLRAPFARRDQFEFESRSRVADHGLGSFLEDS